MRTPDLDGLRALARSSPWRWRTLQVTVEWTGQRVEHPRPVRAWVSRPHGLRVEELDGTPVQAFWNDHPWGWNDSYELFGPLDARAPTPTWRPDGWVARRPDAGYLNVDDPMFQTYRWVSMLDPVELADGAPLIDGGALARDPALAPISLVGAVTQVEQAGRPAWEAVVLTTDDYEPRCGCCPVLWGSHSEYRESLSGAPLGRGPWPDAHRVRLDVGTGIVVLSEELGGPTPGRGWTAAVEAVDAELDRRLFDAFP